MRIALRSIALALGAVFVLSALMVAHARAADGAAPNLPATHGHRHVTHAPRYDGVINVDGGHTSVQVVVAVDKSQLVHVSRSFKEVTVGNRDTADVEVLSSNLLYVLGKKRGTTNISLTDSSGHVVAIVDVVVSYDIAELKERIAELVGEHVEVHPAGDSIALTGSVSSADHLRQVIALATHFAPDPNAVVNMMTVTGSQQVMLQVRFAEVQRSAVRELGINNTVNSNVITASTGIGISDNPFASAIASLVSGKYSLDIEVDALEKKGLVRTLAEPNISALSGESASFLAGGEIPIPVPQATAVGGPALTTIEYKDFGVGLSFTPTVVTKDTVNLVIKSEVSSIDPTVSVTTNGISVPGFKVRRSNTTMELQDGQSFAIAGLIQDDFQDGASQIPGLGNLPIIGALLRSTSYQHNQTELVVFITVHLVKPTIAKTLASPTDLVGLPTPAALFGLGQLDAMDPQGGGIDGTYGYILP